MKKPDRRSIRPADAVWETGLSVIAVSGNELHVAEFSHEAERKEAARKVAAGSLPHDEFDKLGRRLRLDQVSRVAWVPAVNTVLVHTSWVQEPWRIVFENEVDSANAFQAIAAGIPMAGPPVESRVGPHDLQMDQQLGIAIFVAFMAILTLILGAVEGAGEGPVDGPAQVFRVFAQIGQALGVNGVVVVVGVVLVFAVVGFVLWYRMWPRKWVVQASASLAETDIQPGQSHSA